MPPHTPPPPLRLLERPPSRRVLPTRAVAPPTPWWTADGLRRVWLSLLPPA